MDIYSSRVEFSCQLAIIFTLLVGVFASVYLERRSNGGFLEFRQGVKAGFLFSIILGIIAGTFSLIYYKVLAPDVIEYIMSEEKKGMIAHKLSETDIAKNLEVIESYFGFFRICMSTIFVGVLFSLLASAVFRKKNPVPPFSAN
jgi:uncharacterized membrane protein YeaQ/YmgE (transglycosylase-associated protein family)